MIQHAYGVRTPVDLSQLLTGQLRADAGHPGLAWPGLAGWQAGRLARADGPMRALPKCAIP